MGHRPEINPRSVGESATVVTCQMYGTRQRSYEGKGGSTPDKRLLTWCWKKSNLEAMTTDNTGGEEE